ncbi:hypothetical protein [Dehalococcoides mccartyi]|jgi:hypothetical protein|uniref:hypothetical protein n=1 Tax=Dehalococcoides mccartyi TaxID=61435 RepID=UPI00098E9D5C|nr:hypothetical protein [Dehalococcoides mccartyi]AQU06083.1 hypothetical protein B1777_05210 [Dehalococcoides mccartyi]AQU07527.1 hypothetical protein B1778_05015 [Dehalococcoides mccartyi]AQX74773.1 hypothetical protein B1776_04310 [Dehalococcoides mccartyi]AQY73350.1 hypothetical protein B1772_04620 [Dehalococcoides mccartyi]QBX64051.1 hypothetical protein DhcFL2_04650 [Dehalococcoides mccartyi]
MKIEINIRNVRNIKTSVQMVEQKDEDPVLVTKLQIEAVIPPTDIARIINLVGQPIPVHITIGTPQSAFDLALGNTRNIEMAEV